MNARQFHFTSDGSAVLGPVGADWLWNRVNLGQLPATISVCEVGTDDWLPFTSLPDAVFSVRVLTQAVQQRQNAAEAEELHWQAQQRLLKCQSHIEVYGYRSAEIEQTARDGLEFVNAALKFAPSNPVYLNTKGLLFSDGLGQKDAGMTFLDMAAKRAPKDIQIRQNVRNLSQQQGGCFGVLVLGGAFLLFCLRLL